MTLFDRITASLQTFAQRLYEAAQAAELSHEEVLAQRVSQLEQRLRQLERPRRRA
jgi:Tfp pilus assembly ATPase PilU